MWVICVPGPPRVCNQVILPSCRYLFFGTRVTLLRTRSFLPLTRAGYYLITLSILRSAYSVFD